MPTAEVETVFKAGIHTHIIDNNGNIPYTILESRDHHVAKETSNHFNLNRILSILQDESAEGQFFIGNYIYRVTFGNTEEYLLGEILIISN